MTKDIDKSKIGLIAGLAGLVILATVGILTGLIPALLPLKIALGILGLSVLVVVHEFGHFIAARAVGIEVITFSIGFGPKLLSKKLLLGKDKKETEFCLSLLPLGGYCRLKGEHSMLQAWEQKLTHIPHEEGALFAVAPWRRIIVSLAGPLANFLLAILLMTTLFIARYEIKYLEPRVVLLSETREGSFPADKAGIQTGDTILSINGNDISTFSEIKEYVAFSPDKEQTLLVLRDGKNLELIVKPQINKEGTSGIIGVYPYVEPIISELTPAESTLFKIDDRITKLDGTPVKEAIGFINRLTPGQNHTAEIIRNGQTKSIEFAVPETGELSFSFPEQIGKSPKMNPVKALWAGTKESASMFKMTIKGLRLLFTGKVSVTKSLSGPIRIINTTGNIAMMMFGEEAGYGVALFIQFIVLISVSLAFMNLLPIPALDGGQVLLFTYDAVTKKELKPSLVYYYQTVGAVMVLGLVFMAFFLDISSFIGPLTGH